MLKCHISLSTLIPKHSSLSTLLQKLFITTFQQWQLARKCLWRVSSDNIVIKFINNEDNFQITILNCEFKDGYLKNHCNWIMYKDGYTKPSLNVYTFFAFSLSYRITIGLFSLLFSLSLSLIRQRTGRVSSPQLLQHGTKGVCSLSLSLSLLCPFMPHTILKSLETNHTYPNPSLHYSYT